MKSAGKRRGIRTILLFVFAACLVAAGGIGTAGAVPTKVSEYYSGGMETYDIGVTLLENGKAVSSRGTAGGSGYVSDERYGALLEELVPEGQQFHMGQSYGEELSVSNSGSIDAYIRVTIYKYWLRGTEKDTTLAPEMIDLHLVTDNGWTVDESSSSAERTVLYYTAALGAGEETPAFTDTLQVSGELPYKVEQTRNNNEITTTYAYEDVTFQIEVQVDAVQTHSGEEAIRSAWGSDVKVSGERLELQ